MGLHEQAATTVTCRCGYLTLTKQDKLLSFPLAQSLRLCLPDDVIHKIVRDSDDPEHIQAVVETGLQYCLQRITAMVTAEPTTAAAAMWPCLAMFDATSREYRRGARAEGQRLPLIGRAIQILLVCLYQQGMTRLPSGTSDGDALRSFIGRFSETATNATSLGSILANLEWGLFQGELKDGVLSARTSPLNARLVEWNLNRDALWQRTRNTYTSDDVFSAASAAAQEIFLGCSPADGRKLFVDGHALLRSMASRQEDAVYQIPEVACSEPLRCLFDHLTLTPERLARFALPFYWDLGTDEEGPANRQRDLRKVAVRNWFNYYPLIPVETQTGGPGFFVSSEYLTYALANLESDKGRMLQRIHERLTQAGQASQAQRDAVGALRKEANTRFEALAAERARELGFAAMVGLYRLDGAVMPGGEIDLLMASAQGDNALLVLGEVKDFDMTLMRVHGEKNLGGKIRAAERQLDRKAEDVRKNWRRLLDVVSEGRLRPPTGQVVLVKVLISSSYLPTFLSSSYPAIALEQMAEFTAMLRQGADAFPPRFAATAREVLA